MDYSSTVRETQAEMKKNIIFCIHGEKTFPFVCESGILKKNKKKEAHT